MTRDEQLQSSPSAVEYRPLQTALFTVEDRPSQTSPPIVHVDDDSPPPAVEDRPPQTSPSAVGVVPVQASIPIASAVGLMENRPLSIVRSTFLHIVSSGTTSVYRLQRKTCLTV